MESQKRDKQKADVPSKSHFILHNNMIVRTFISDFEKKNQNLFQ